MLQPGYLKRAIYLLTTVLLLSSWCALAAPSPILNSKGLSLVRYDSETEPIWKITGKHVAPSGTAMTVTDYKLSIYNSDEQKKALTLTGPQLLLSSQHQLITTSGQVQFSKERRYSGEFSDLHLTWNPWTLRGSSLSLNSASQQRFVGLNGSKFYYQIGRENFEISGGFRLSLANNDRSITVSGQSVSFRPGGPVRITKRATLTIESRLSIASDRMSWNSEKGLLWGTGNVNIHKSDTEIEAGSFQYNLSTGLLKLSGGVTLKMSGTK